MDGSRIVCLACSGLVGMATSLPALAEFKLVPYVAGVIEFDNNLPRLPNDSAAVARRGEPHREDTITRYTLGFDSFYAIGLQKFKLVAFVNRTEHNRYTELDFNGHQVSGTWEWGIGSRLGGNLTVVDERALENFANRIDDSTQRSFVDSTTVAFDTSYRLFGNVDLRPAFDTRRTRHTLPSSQRQDLDEDTARFGVSYVPSTKGDIGVEVALTQGEFVQRQPAAGLVEEYEQLTTQAVGTWKPSPLTSLTFSLGFSQRDNQGLEVGNDSGLVGKLNLKRQISAKTSAYVGAYRNLSSSDLQGESTVETTGWDAGASWAPTAKLKLDASYLFQEEVYEDSTLFLPPGAEPLPENPDRAPSRRSDDVQSATLSLNYTPIEWLIIGPYYRWQDRSSELQSQDYHAYQVGIEARFQYEVW